MSLRQKLMSASLAFSMLGGCLAIAAPAQAGAVGDALKSMNISKKFPSYNNCLTYNRIFVKNATRQKAKPTYQSCTRAADGIFTSVLIFDRPIYS